MNKKSFVYKFKKFINIKKENNELKENIFKEKKSNTGKPHVSGVMNIQRYTDK